MDRFYPKRFAPWPDGQGAYDHFNVKYFGGGLPIVYVGLYKMKNYTYGCTIRQHGMKYCSHILLNPYFEKWPDVTKQNILHEMIHVKFRNRHGHGPRFKKEMRRLLLAGAFDDTL